MKSRLIGTTVIHLEKVTSTNTYAIELLRTSHPQEGTIVSTVNQTRGKGLDQNTWESEPGKNLAFTIILYPHFLPVDRQFELNKIFALGVCDLIQKLLPSEKVSIKWPNDIYAGDRKISGMLIQNSIMSNRFDYLIAGIGINVNQVNFPSSLPNPVSLKNLADEDFVLDEVLTKCCETINSRYEQLMESKFNVIDRDYLDNLYRYKEWHDFKIRGEIFKSQVTGVSLYGKLKLVTESGARYECDLKEVQFIL